MYILNQSPLGRTQDGTTALAAACGNGHIEVVKELLQAKANVQLADEVRRLRLNTKLWLRAMQRSLL
jgi:ankyrin repeat protein